MKERARDFAADETAVSEIIGYAFAFSIILSVVVFVSLASGPIIDSAQSEEAATSMQHTFMQFDNEVQQMQDGADTGTFEGDIPAGQLRQVDQTIITFNQSTGDSMRIRTHPLHYQTQTGEVVAYDAGFVAHTPPQAGWEATSLTYRNPEAYMTNDPVMAIPALEEASGLSTHSSSRSSTVHFQLQRIDSMKSANTQTFAASGGNVTMNVATDLPGAWVTYMEDHPAITDVSYDSSSGTVEGTVDMSDPDTDQFTVSSQEVALLFNS